MGPNTRASGEGAGAPMTVGSAWDGYVRTATVDPKTMSVYEGVFVRHVAPALGDVPVAEVTRDDVVRLLEGLRARGASASLVRLARVVLAAACRHAQSQRVIGVLPTDGVPAPHSEAVVERVMTPQEFVRVREQLPTEGARLLAELLVRSGLRVGEALALRPADVGDGELLVRRCLSEPGRRFSADGERFVLRPSTKNGQPRRVDVGRAFTERLLAWCAAAGLQDEELLLPARLVLPPPSGRSFPRRIHTEPLTAQRLAGLGSFTGPNGRRYQHGTVNGYVTGKCRSACCRQAISEYSAQKRRERRQAQRADEVPRRPRVRGAGAPVDSAASSGVAGIGAVSHQGWSALWAAAVASAELDFRPLASQTRHAHASWLNEGGVSAERIAERLGHRDERSTRRYVRPVGREAGPVAVVGSLLDGEDHLAPEAGA
ncbi:tyrosine-type recombinase/integrase [Quadrisphaera sp. KR29]|uniref:tyrosine-type recombinase/integrase n=1 Tax=Quadrisphaera sp. KR29 TaxID=3461391 RepID=UPI004044CF90